MQIKEKYYLQIADNALILSHRLSEYSSYGPYLEEDLATTNVALDLIGIAESIYEEISNFSGDGRKADDIVFRRAESEFFNCLLVEQPNTDFAFIMVRQFFADAFHYYFFNELVRSNDAFLAELSVKSIKEIAYHLRRSSEWMIRLGDGTEIAHEKTQHAVNVLWKFTHEFFLPNEVDQKMLDDGIGVSLEGVQSAWMSKVREIFYMSSLKVPQLSSFEVGGKQGVHTEHLGHMLSEMQFLPSTYPDAVW